MRQPVFLRHPPWISEDALKRIGIGSWMGWIMINKSIPEGDEGLEYTLGKFDSWEIVREDVARKTCDKYFYEHNGSGIHTLVLK